MTAALDVTSSMPVWTVDTLEVGALRRTDDLGREWGVKAGTDTGWITSASPRTRREARPNGHGAFRGVAWRDYRQFTLGGVVACPDGPTREQTEVELAGLCSDPGRLYEFRRRTATFDQVTRVELDDAPKIEMVSFYTLEWLFTFAAPDPRKHSFAWQDPILNPAGASFSGLEFADPGLGFDLDFGATTTAGTAQVANYGTAPAYPLFQLTGPLSQPTIVHLDSGRTISYASEIATGERVSINCDEFPQRGIPPHGRVSSTRGNVGALCTIGTEWPVVNPQTTASFALRGTGAPTAELKCSLRSAYW